MCFNKCLSNIVKLCVVLNKVNFITNIINSIRIHIFYFYNKKYTFINTDITFITKHINFIKINKNPVTGPKCSPLLKCKAMNGITLFSHNFIINIIFIIYQL